MIGALLVVSLGLVTAVGSVVAGSSLGLITACSIVGLWILAIVRDIWVGLRFLAELGEERSNPLITPQTLTSLGRQIIDRGEALRYRFETSAWERVASSMLAEVVPGSIYDRLTSAGAPKIPEQQGEALREVLTRAERALRAELAAVADVREGSVKLVHNRAWGERLTARVTDSISHGHSTARNKGIATLGELTTLGLGEMVLAYLGVSDERELYLWLALPQGAVMTTARHQAIETFSKAVAAELSLVSTMQALSSQAASAKQHSVVRGELLAHVSHDIRSPLSNVKAILNLLRESQREPQHHDLIEVAMSTCDTIAEMAEDILEFSRQASGHLTTNPEVVSLDPILKDVVMTFAVPARVKGITMERVGSGVVPPIRADRRQVRRILSNLVSNAVKYTQRGAVTIRVESSEDRVTVAVTDTGVGMTSEQLRQLFTPFMRFGTTAAEGCGLGLVVCRTLVEANGGEISVSSIPEVGSTFRVSFPRAVVVASVVEEGSVIASKTRVLLADDDADYIHAMARGLCQRGFEVTTVGSGQELVRLLAEREFDCIVSDDQMPGGGALQALQTFAGQVTPLIVLSGREVDEERYRAEGAAAVATKPITTAALGEVITSVVNRARDKHRLVA